MTDHPSDLAFTPSVKAIQASMGSRDHYEEAVHHHGWQTSVNAELEAFLARTRSAFLATVNADGQPYIQHRGGPPGFLRVMDDQHIACADYAGNRQYISTGNLQDNAKIHLFLIDYERTARIKLWGTARMINDDPALAQQLMPSGYRARPERVLMIRVTVWDWNCPQHIPQRFEAEDVARALAERDQKIAYLQERLKVLEADQRTST